jgi:hypothetical protein
MVLPEKKKKPATIGFCRYLIQYSLPSDNGPERSDFNPYDLESQEIAVINSGGLHVAFSPFFALMITERFQYHLKAQAVTIVIVASSESCRSARDDRQEDFKDP